MQINLESLIVAWQAAPPERRNAALSVLRDGPQKSTGPRVIRWKDAAAQLSISVRSLRYACENAGIERVTLPGRNRSFGIRESDLATLAGEG